ncbi:MAG: adenosylmethionine--8-amino-7-oxononanoate transaminase [Thermodesulfovibrio sp.]|nr:adenosylmethionine--8-amino-7-oxononanoate transaminase [Thermodesulfovibrio sp.]
MHDAGNLEDSDKKHIWHPFTQMKEWAEEHPIIIAEGEGCFLTDVSGRRYLDGVSSLWVNIHGHRKQEINEAVRSQLDKIAHTTLLGLSNVPAIQLAERLVKLLPGAGLLPDPVLSRVFYSDNGSTAVEVALKMAFQYWRQKGVEGKHSFLSLNNAYHGDTIGAVSVGGVDIFHNVFGPLLFKTFRAASPYCYRCELKKSHPDCGLACLQNMESLLSSHHQEIAAVIIEPLVQAAGGMIVSPPGYLRGVRELATKYNVLLIADEVATGFGRTGAMFACGHEAVVPDIICISKGLTGGYLPLAATVASEEIYAAFLGDFRDLKTFFHGHSYTGNPLGCAAALACLDIFEHERVIEGMAPKIELFGKELQAIAGMGHVGDVRHRGLMAGIELVRDKETREPYAWEEKRGWQVALKAREKGLLIRPLGNVIVLMPPLSITAEELAWMLGVVRESIREVI